VFSSGFFVIHDTERCSQNKVSKLFRWENIGAELIETRQNDIVSGTDNTALVDSSNEFYNNLSRSVVIYNFEFSNVFCANLMVRVRKEHMGLTMLQHHLKKLHNNLRARSNKNLSLSSLFCIVNALKGIC
jgi:hypothetical protein